MESGIIIGIQNCIFIILLAFITIKCFRQRNVNEKHHIFTWAMFVATMAQTANTLAEMVDHDVFSVPNWVSFIINFALMWLISMQAACCLKYLIHIYNAKAEFNRVQKIIFHIPMVVIIIGCIISPWTHAVFFINASGHYQRGNLFFIQVVCPYSYLFFSFLMLLNSLFRKKTNATKMIRTFIAYCIPAMIGSAVQVIFNIDGGYSVLGTSISCIMLYLEFYMDEVNEVEKLRAVEGLNIKLQEEQKENEKELKIVQALCKSYLNVYLVDMVSGQVEVIKLDGYIPDAVDKGEETKYSYDIVSKSYIDKRVYADDIEYVTQCMSWDNVKKQLSEKASFEFNYRVIENGEIHHYQGLYRTINDRYFVGGFQNVDAAVANEEKKNSELKKNLEIIQSLACTYHSIYYVDMLDKSFIELGTSKESVENVIGAKGNAKKALADMCEYIIVPEQRDAMSEFANIDTVNERLKDRNWISKQFLGTTGLWSEGFFIAVDRDNNGDCTHVIWAVRDIDETKKKEIEYHKELERQIDIVGGLSNAYFAFYSGNLVTGAFAPIKEIPFTHEIFKNCNNMKDAAKVYISRGVNDEDVDLMTQFLDVDTLADRLQDTNVISVETRGEITGLEWCRANWIVAGRDENGRVKRVLYAVEEVSASVAERKKQQHELEVARNLAEAANRAKSTFLFNMSHDIRTPMNAIIGFTDLLKDCLDDREKCEDYLSKVDSASKFLLSLINDVLEMARIESGNLVLEEDVYPTTKSLDMVCSLFEEQMQKKNLEFNRTIDINHDYVYYDAVKIREILLNIISNAYKYTPEGGKIAVEVKELPSNREGYALFETKVKDTGIGMSKEYLPHLYDEFTRENNATKSKIEGTGLGMPIVRKMVELMDGTIDVESELGKGTTFTVRLYHRIANSSEQGEEKKLSYNLEMFKGKRILLAEDNDLNAKIAEAVLNKAGFIVDRAEDGDVCVDMYDNATDDYYDAILMDIQMPKMNGYDATRAIRNMDNVYKRDIPIIAMTANAFDEDKKDAIDAGMNAHVAKPVNVPKLMEILAEYL